MSDDQLFTMARFLVMPGAAELLDAFSRIPEGPLRAATIAQVQAMAEAYAGSPATAQDPLTRLAGAAPPPARPTPVEPPKALPAPAETRTRRGQPKTLEEQVIDLRMKGKGAKDIAEETGAPRQEVSAILNAATRGGMAFPKRAAASTESKTFPLHKTELSSQGQAAMERAALQLGKSLEQYLAARRALVRMRKTGAPMGRIAAETGFPEKTLWAWLYTARGAGLDLPLRTEEHDAEFEPVYPLPIEQMEPRHQTVLRQAAARAGLTVEAYQERQRDIVRRRLAGGYPTQIAEALNLPRHEVGHVISAAQAAGYVFPVLLTGSGARKAMGRANILGGFAKAAKDRKAADDAASQPQADDDDGEIVEHPFAPPRQRGPVRFPLFVDELEDGGGRIQVERAAERMSATLEGYMALRRSAVAMFIRGVRPADVAAALGLDAKMAANWHHNSLAAGRQVIGQAPPEVLAEIAAAAPQEAENA